MKEDFVKEGMWCTSMEFENVYFGRLIFSKNDGLILELKGVFDIYKIRNLRNMTIYGKTDHYNLNVTLMGCDQMRWGNSYIDFKVQSCFLGHHLEKPDEIKLKSAKFEYFGLQDYLGRSGFNVSKNDNYEFSVNYKRNKLPIIKIDDLEIGIHQSYNQVSNSDRGKSGEIEIKMKEYITVKYDYQNEININRCMEDSQCFSFFMSTVSNNIIYPKYIELTLGDGKNVVYLYKNPYFKNKYDNDDNNFLSFDRLDLTEIIPKWFTFKKSFFTFANYKRVADLYHNHYDENRLLDSLTVLETFYREFRDNDMDKSFAVTIQNILSADIIPENQMDFFTSRLQGGKSNYRKYCDLYYSLPKNCRTKISENLNKYCRYLTNSRNAYTHNNRDGKVILRDKYMIRSTENNELLIKFLLLKEIGIDLSFIESSFEYEFHSISLKEIEELHQAYSIAS
jgi:hypothetical protein